VTESADGGGLGNVARPDERLDSWKAIAAYLKRDVRTAQRWERQENLPVHRHVHQSHGSVYAFPAELDAWRAGRRDLAAEPPLLLDPGPTRRGRTLAYAAATTGLVIGCLALVYTTTMRDPSPGQPIHFIVEVAEGTRLSRYSAPAISPNGSHLVFGATSATGQDALWVRELGSVRIRELPGTDGGVFPFWAPDSRRVGFFAHGKLTVTDIDGGPPRVVCDSPGFYGGTWSEQDVILFAPTNDAIFRVAATGGAATPVTAVNPSAHEVAHMWPEFLPDGQRFLFLANGGPGATRDIRLGSLDTAETRPVAGNASHAVFALPDRLLFVQGRTLKAQRFDLRTGELSGQPVTVADDVGVRQPIGRGAFSVSRTGVLAYRSDDGVMAQPVVVDRVGRRLHEFAPAADYDQPQFSPDERSVAVSVANPRGEAGRTLWVLDSRSQRAPLSLGSSGSGPIWSPDGQAIAFTGRREGPGDLYRRATASGSDDEMVLRSAEWKIVTDWSADGMTLVFQQQALKTGWDIWTLGLSHERRTTPVLQGGANEVQGRLSHDAGWLAYASDESGRMEVYVRRFPLTDALWKVSEHGGTQPQWRHDDRELFYVNGAGHLVAVSVSAEQPLQLGAGQTLFALSSDGVLTTPGTFHYSAARDGQKFLVNTAVASDTPRLTVVVNWTAQLTEP
jgi:Tol biopolymer transport system component